MLVYVGVESVYGGLVYGWFNGRVMEILLL